MKVVRRFGIKGKLAPRYIGLYPVIDKYVPTSYQVELSVRLSGVHNVFHVSQLKRCLKLPTRLSGVQHLLLRPLDHLSIAGDQRTPAHTDFA
jgi:hypothetical protein